MSRIGMVLASMPPGHWSLRSDLIGGTIDPSDLPQRPLPEKIVGTPIELKPIPWGKPDPELGRGVCRHIADVNAPTVIPFNPLTETKLHSLLRQLHIVHH